MGPTEVEPFARFRILPELLDARLATGLMTPSPEVNVTRSRLEAGGSIKATASQLAPTDSRAETRGRLKIPTAETAGGQVISFTY